MKPGSIFYLLAAIVIVAFGACNNPDPSTNTVIVPRKARTVDSVASPAAANPYVSFDQSPMDMSYFPANYPILRMNGTDTFKLIARVIYSRPKKKGRTIFGTDEKSLCVYGKEWRLGANEATEVQLFKDVMAGDKKIPKGSYVLYCIPQPDVWEIRFNTNLHTWGLHMDPRKDFAAVKVPVLLQSPALEDFTIVFEQTNDGAMMIMAWGDARIQLPLKFKAQPQPAI
jgi:Protein of unknown function (DUF2911)